MTAAASESVASVSPRTTTMLLLALATLPLVAPFASTPTHHHGDHEHDWTIEVAHDHSQDHATDGRAARSVCAGGISLGLPAAWGTPPADACDEPLVLLEGGYGVGPTTLAAWVSEKMRHDHDYGEPKYPLKWGAPPLRLTRDLVPLPCGYDSGSSTIREWILHQSALHKRAWRSDVPENLCEPG